MIKYKLVIRLISFLICFAMFLAIAGSSVISAGTKTSVKPTVTELDIIDEAVAFLDDMDMSDMADNIRQWVKDKKIEIDPKLTAAGTTTAKGTIIIRKSFVTPLPQDKYDRFERIIDLATVLYHEKIHVHQAPLGGALSAGVELGDWSASNDVMKECVGPDPLEVDAFYKQVRALLKWWQKIEAEPIPSSLSGNAKDEAEAFKEYKKSFILGKADTIMQILKNLKYEKAEKFDDVEYLKDLFMVIVDSGNLSEAEIVQQLIDLLDSLISKLFDKDGFYDKCRKKYAEKKGDKKTSMAIPAEPGSTIEYVLDLPEGNGYLSIAGLPADLDVGENEFFNIEVTEFMIPPEADAGYAIISPVYEISWNSYSPVPFDITIYMEDMASPDMMIKAFALTKTKEESSWTNLETTIISEGDFSILTASSDTTTMFAVVVPAISYLDMPPAHWAYDSTARLKMEGVLDEGIVLYSEMEVSRELFIKYLVRALSLDLVTDSVPFTDVEESDPYFPYISTAYHNGLTTGVAADSFGTGEIIPREQSITFLIRAIGMEEIALAMDEDTMMGYIDSFFDIYTDCSEWAYPYLSQAVKILMLEGYPDSTLRGKNLLSHTEVIALIDRIMIHIIYNSR